MFNGVKINPPFFEVGPKAIIWGEQMLALAKVIDKTAMKYDVDVMLTYGEGVEVKDIVGVVEALNKEGKSVRASATADANIRYRQRMHLEKKVTGIEVIEKYD